MKKFSCTEKKTMLVLSLENFRCYSGRHSFSFGEAPTTLIAGHTNAGKSTLLKAIAWCLYGKERRVLPWTKKSTTKCWVEVELRGIVKILRQKAPERITVTTAAGRTFTQDEAQLWIINQYGDHEVWMAACYLRQKTTSPFLAGSNADKLRLLEKLLFTNQESPAVTIEKITGRRKAARELLDRATAVHDSLAAHAKPQPIAGDLDTVSQPRLNELRVRIAQAEARAARHEAHQLWWAEHDHLHRELHGLGQDAVWTVEELTTYQAETTRLTLLADAMDKVDTSKTAPPAPGDIEGMVASLAEIEQRRVWFRKRFGDVPFTQEAWEAMRDRVQLVVDTHDLVQQQRQVADELGKCGACAVPESVAPLTDEELFALKRQSADYAEYRRQCQALKVPASMEDAERFAALVPFLDAYRKWQALMTQQPKEVATAEDVEILKEELREAEQRRAHLTCPHCTKTVRLENGKLVKAIGRPSAGVEDDLQRQLVEAQASLAWHGKVALLEGQWHVGGHASSDLDWALDQRQYEVVGFPQWFAKVRALRPVEAPPGPYTYEQHALHAKRQALQSKADALQQQLRKRRVDVADEFYRQPVNVLIGWAEKLAAPWVPTVPFTEPELRAWQVIHRLGGMVVVARPDLGARNALLDHQRALAQRYAELERRRPGEDADVDAAIPETSLSELREELHRCLVLLPWKEAEAHLQAARVQREEAERVWQRWTMIAEKAKVLEFSMLEGAVAAFNDTLNTIMSDIFDNQMLMFVEMFRGEKAEIAMRVIYKGGEDESLDDLSGGEEDRCSLAITLALAVHSPWPYVMLDECFGSLDMAMRERCLDLIKRVLVGKHALVIAHEEVEGNYEGIFRVVEP